MNKWKKNSCFSAILQTRILLLIELLVFVFKLQPYPNFGITSE